MTEHARAARGEGRPVALDAATPSGLETGGTKVQLQALQTVAKVATAVLSHLDLESTLLSVVNATLDLLGGDIVGLLLADEDDDVLRMRACAGHRTIHTAHLEVRRGEGVAGKVFETGSPFKTNDYQSDTSFSGHFLSVAQEDGTRAALGAPMTVRGKVIGASWCGAAIHRPSATPTSTP